MISKLQRGAAKGVLRVSVSVRAVSTVSAGDFMTAVRAGHAANRFEVVDVREKNELALASLDNYIKTINLPLSEFSSWGEIIDEKLERSKKIYCLVSARFVECTMTLTSAFLCSAITVSGP